ncbi:hypothetical protein J3T78_02425 [Staphylococcus nepalensis]|uniref:DUF1381 domain-containing protein n=1 Tax=Staphylococcus nepalensis TaxID=214473 RepID=A0ABS3L3T1_9STAP|nr:hypothetical protein [Staphylococcus nepalensis]MBO1214101.1 hypothetical protein [Staphylococcus nepalensis]MBO1217405.1 hypothetical protein [Staphylococcus nepalensis]MBO1228215.1 hypothetical protein [Staphylococcus nepalensis]MBO1233747.1 hypothetical protein [Staphylococcus nepalensis]MBO1236563.1 hypothetical protein [Staphylococcus nepalensis]
MQYLVRKIHHTTDEVFLDATKAKENETFVVVDAESAEEAKKIVRYKIMIKKIRQTLENNKLLQAIRKDSE